MSLKKILSLIAICIVVVVSIFTLYGCKNSGNKAKGTANSQKEEYTGTINVWSITGAGDTVKVASDTVKVASDTVKVASDTVKVASDAIKFAGDSYKNKYPKVQINVKKVSGTSFSEEFEKAYKASSELPDVLVLNDSMVPYYLAKYPDAFANVTDVFNSIKNDMVDSKVNLEASSNIKHSIPWNNSPSVMYYRTDIYEKYGININEIITWDDFIDAGKAIYDKSAGKVKTIPIDMKDSNSTYKMLLSQLGQSYFDDLGRPVINSKNSIKVLNLMKKITDSKISADANYNALIKGIKDNSIASVPYGITLANYLKANISDQSGKWTVKKLPSFEPGGTNTSAASGLSFLILDKSLNKKTATDYIKYSVSDTKVLTDLCSSYGLLPAYKPAYAKEAFNNKAEYFNGQMVWKLFSEVSIDALPVSYSQSFDSIQSILTKAEDKIFTNAALDSAGITAIMDETQLEAENQWVQDNIQLSDKSKN